jgi:hypothetical protein
MRSNLALIVLWVILTVLVSSCYEIPEVTYEEETTDSVTIETTVPTERPAEERKSTMVFICTGDKSKSYHYSPSCSTLGQCAGDVEEIEIGEVESWDRRDPCNMCAGGN